MIPRQIHIIWVGDQTKRPDNCIRTWVERNPSWRVKIWGNQDLADHGWVNASHIQQMARREINGVADLMRWDILYNLGGFVVDADSICVRPLEDWLLNAEAFACWENEIARPDLIAAGYVASSPGNPFFGQIIVDLQRQPSVTNGMAWETVGPMCLTRAFRAHRYDGLSILPSHMFIPEHYTGLRYEGAGIVFARQEWASTRRTYDALHLKQID
jgi:mannosyltransferase OCH1-like enzyme